MRLIFFGSAQFGIPSLQALKASGDDLVHIFTQPARPAGRNRKPRPTPVTAWAEQNLIPCTETKVVNSPDILEKITACKADLLVVIAFGQKIGREVLQIPPKGTINVHASLVPKYRGAAPINWAIINGETQTGISIITVADKMDAGDVLAQAATAIADDDTAETLHDKLADLSPPVLLEVIAQIDAGSAQYTPQDDSQVTLAPKLKKSDSLINWRQSAESIRNRICGIWPWPGAKADFVSHQTGKRYQVTIATARVASTSLQPKGKSGLLDSELNVICRSGSLQILQLKPADGNLMDFKDFVNGRAVKTGDLFAPVSELR